MGNFTTDPGGCQPPVKITQNAGDLKAGYERGEDYSRISAYTNKGKGEGGVHTGARSETVGRHDQEFNSK